MRKLGLILGLILTLSVLTAENSLILDIKITGNENIEKELVQSIISFEVGDIVTDENISKSIKNLYQLGVFENIQIEKKELPQGISVSIIIKEFPIVSSIEFSGNKKISDTKIKESINLKEGSYWSPFLKTEITKTILDEYKKKGYHLAVIDFRAIELDQNKTDVFIEINEGTKVAIKKIRIHGNKEVQSKKLLGKMKTKKASLLRSGKFDSEKFEEDLEKIVTYYNKKGFIDVRIISWEKKLVEDKFIIDIYLYEGNQFYFGEVFVSGNERFTEEIITSQFKFKDDEVFNMEKFNKQLGSVSAMYYEEGYIYSNFDYDLAKTGEKINIKLRIVENTRARVRKIAIIGNRKTKEKIIRRQLVIAPGNYFQQSKVMRTQQNIYNMGFFEPDIYLDNPTIINQNGDIDLAIHVNDRVSGSANGGIALNSQDGIVGQLAVSHNNLFGNSWQSGFKWEFGGKVQNYSFNFTNPYFMDSNILVGFEVYHTTKEWSTYEIKTNGGMIRLGKPVNFLNYAKIVGGYSLYSKKYRIFSSIDPDDVSDNLSELDQKGWQNTSSLSLTFSRDSRDNVFFPSSGSQFTLYSEFAGGPLQGDFKYFKQIAQISWYTKTVWKLALRTKWRFGYVTGYNDSEVPPDERFYLGGTGPDGIRGYSDRSIGPIEGGHREIIFSTELGVPIASDQIIGLLFFDAGNCFNSLENYNFWNMKRGAGMGVRIRSPFGLIGFDYAHNFESRRWEPHFQFGTTF